MKKQAISLLLLFLFLVSLLPAIGGGQAGAAGEAQVPAAEEAPAVDEGPPGESAEELAEDEPVEEERQLASSGKCGNNVTWALDEAGTLTISGSGEMTSHPWDSSAVKRAVINSGVTSIGGGAFSGCFRLTSISLPSGVTSIGSWAFGGCVSLTVIGIGSSVTSIGGDAFYGCSSLKDVLYAGSETQWNAISLDSGNNYLKNATIHYGAVAGDVNGDSRLTLADVSLLYRGLTGAVTGVNTILADMNGDGKVNLRDVAVLFKLCRA